MTLDPQPSDALQAPDDRIRDTASVPTPSGCIPDHRWFVLIAKYGQHQLAERSLAADGWRTFFPLMVDRAHGNRLTPLFASYAFIAIRTGDIGWPRIYSTRGVFTLLSRERRPLPLPVGAVESLQARTSDRRVVDDPLEHPEARIPLGATGTVVQGPWAGWDGVVALSRARRLTLLLRCFGRVVKVELPQSAVVPSWEGDVDDAARAARRAKPVRYRAA